jgi:hypothetical protein
MNEYVIMDASGEFLSRLEENTWTPFARWAKTFSAERAYFEMVKWGEIKGVPCAAIQVRCLPKGRDYAAVDERSSQAFAA